MYKIEFINKAKKIHGDKYDYSKVPNIFKTTDKITIICPEHGEFEQNAGNHNQGRGCPKCRLIKLSNIKTLSTQEFIEKAKKVHGDNKYDYSKVDYKHSQEKVIIICPKHGEFKQLPNGHLRGIGCPNCYYDNKKSNTQEFIEKAKQIHGDYYNYSKVDYKHSQEKVIIICPEHGEFEQISNSHLQGKGCQKCYINNKTLSTEEFIEKSKQIHCDKYDYSKVEYNHSIEKVIIICPEHGEFEQIPQSHLRGIGCPRCAHIISKAEQEIVDYLINDLKLNVQQSNRDILSGNRELDIYIPDLKVAIEYNGLYFHNELFRDKNYHIKKTEECRSKGIRLIHIFEDEWLYKTGIVKSRLSNILNKTKFTTYARKCFVKEIEDNDEVRQFLVTNHIQGFVGSKIKLGLYYTDKITGRTKLLGIMTFGSLRKNLGHSTTNNNNNDSDTYELLRFANYQNLNIVGGASKLLKYFIKHYKPKSIISYCDLRWSEGNLYEKLGFSLSHISKPNYFYVIGNQRHNRFEFRKDLLIRDYGCSHEDTEHNFCYNQGWYRIYDCGTKVYTLNI